jgi:hypothetical protein
MAMTFAYGKILNWKGDKIGVNTIVKYKDQNGVESGIDIKKFVELAEQCKTPENKEYFDKWLPLIKNKELSIGVVVIDGLGRIAVELGEKAYNCIKEDKND